MIVYFIMNLISQKEMIHDENYSTCWTRGPKKMQTADDTFDVKNMLPLKTM